MAKPRSHTSVRVDPATLARLDKLAAWLVQRSPGLEPRRSYASRAALLEGLTVLEARMAAEQPAKGAKGPPERSAPRPSKG